MAKNYIVFVNDHSGSMDDLARAAMRDYNANIASIVNAANTEKLDTIVSVIGLGYPSGNTITRQVVISNPHVLHPKTDWPTLGGTPLFDAIGEAIKLHQQLPDYADPEVSFLVFVTTDGRDEHSKVYNRSRIVDLIRSLNKDGRWTIVCRVPKGLRYSLDNLDIPAGNIQEWETTEAGMRASTVATQSAVDTYFRDKASGKKSSTVFYADATNVNTNALQEIDMKGEKIALYVIDPQDNGIEIMPFILTKRQQYLKGAAFYQLTKTEARIQPDKEIILRDRKTGKLYGGPSARKAIGLDTINNARLHPGDHGNYDVFIQSESINRKLVGGSGLLYWEAKGTQFTQAELDKFAGKSFVPEVKNGVVQLPQVAPTNKPTPSPIPKTPKPANEYVDGKPVQSYPTREEARKTLKSVKDGKFLYGPLKHRWYVFI
jgi:hypothetical protein